MTTQAFHPGGLNATQSLAFFRANGISGVLIPTRHRRMELRSYTCPHMHLDGKVYVADTRILAPRSHHAA